MIFHGWIRLYCRQIRNGKSKIYDHKIDNNNNQNHEPKISSEREMSRKYVKAISEMNEVFDRLFKLDSFPTIYKVRLIRNNDL